MNDEPTTVPDDDSPALLASGYVDGVLTPDERARVEADPSLTARAEAHAAARDAVAAPVESLDAPAKEALLARALDAAVPDEFAPLAAAATSATTGSTRSTPPTGATEPEGTVVPLEQAPSRRRRSWLPLAMGAAAAVALVAVVLAVIRPGGGDSGRTAGPEQSAASRNASAGGNAPVAATAPGLAGAPATTGATESAADQANASTTIAAPGTTPAAGTLAAAAATTAAAPQPAGVAAPGTAATTAAPQQLPDLGTVTTAADLVQAFRAAGFGAARSAASTPRPCAGYPPPLATATFKSAAGYVVRVDGPAGRSTVVVVDERACTPLLEAALPAS